MAKFVAIFVCLVILETGLALICKQCNVNCNDAVDEECLEPGDDQEVACLVETFKDTHNATLYQRKCVLYEKGTKFQCADYPNYTSISCVTCKENRCNAAKNSGHVARGNITANATSHI
ncbi:uncharacterized protein LOC135133020 isoform X3 [Zophobas morio]|uniref:uncharacterized protein LOC135133020 isoform X3 n=1 Tax=Zophobas morio TaxID=2755281 RepID=UPI003083403F